jgi:hypothetical protein
MRNKQLCSGPAVALKSLLCYMWRQCLRYFLSMSYLLVWNCAVLWTVVSCASREVLFHWSLWFTSVFLTDFTICILLWNCRLLHSDLRACYMHTIVLKCCVKLFLTDVWMASQLTLLYRFCYLSLVKFDLHYLWFHYQSQTFSWLAHVLESLCFCVFCRNRMLN